MPRRQVHQERESAPRIRVRPHRAAGSARGVPGPQAVGLGVPGRAQAFFALATAATMLSQAWSAVSCPAGSASARRSSARSSAGTSAERRPARPRRSSSPCSRRRESSGRRPTSPSPCARARSPSPTGSRCPAWRRSPGGWPGCTHRSSCGRRGTAGASRPTPCSWWCCGQDVEHRVADGLAVAGMPEHAALAGDRRLGLIVDQADVVVVERAEVDVLAGVERLHGGDEAQVQRGGIGQLLLERALPPPQRLARHRARPELGRQLLVEDRRRRGCRSG